MGTFETFWELLGIFGHYWNLLVLFGTLPFRADVILQQTFSSSNNHLIKNNTMNDILRNTKLMGALTIATFAIVAFFAYKSYKANKGIDTTKA